MYLYLKYPGFFSVVKLATAKKHTSTMVTETSGGPRDGSRSPNYCLHMLIGLVLDGYPARFGQIPTRTSLTIQFGRGANYVTILFSNIKTTVAAKTHSLLYYFFQIGHNIVILL